MTLFTATVYIALLFTLGVLNYYYARYIYIRL